MITADRARELSELNKNAGLNEILDLIENAAIRGERMINISKNITHHLPKLKELGFTFYYTKGTEYDAIISW